MGQFVSARHCTQRPLATSQTCPSAFEHAPSFVHATQNPRAPSQIGASLGHAGPLSAHPLTHRRVVGSQIIPSPQSRFTPHSTQRWVAPSQRLRSLFVQCVSRRHGKHAPVTTSQCRLETSQSRSRRQIAGEAASGKEVAPPWPLTSARSPLQATTTETMASAASLPVTAVSRGSLAPRRARIRSENG